MYESDRCNRPLRPDTSENIDLGMSGDWPYHNPSRLQRFDRLLSDLKKINKEIKDTIDKYESE